MSTEFHLVDLALVLSQTEKFGSHVSSIPYCHAAICTTSDHQIWVKGRVVNRHDLVDVSIDCFSGLALTHIPNFEFLVVTYWGEFILVVMIPTDILNDRRVSVVKSQNRVDSVR